MLIQHINDLENKLITDFKISAKSGHPVIQGSEREYFIKTFLQNHIAQNVAIGSGIIIDHETKVDDAKNQHDIIIYKKEYPKLNFGLVDAFLIESVVATIEVKSTLDKDKLKNVLIVARKTKLMKKSVITAYKAGHCPPAIINFIVAYQSDLSIDTIKDQIFSFHKGLGLLNQKYHSNDQRCNTPSHSIDAVFVLNKGFVEFNNSPMSLVTENKEGENDMKWVVTKSGTGNLLYLFVLLQCAISNIQGKWLNPYPYVQEFEYNSDEFIES